MNSNPLTDLGIEEGSREKGISIIKLAVHMSPKDSDISPDFLETSPTHKSFRTTWPQAYKLGHFPNNQKVPWSVFLLHSFMQQLTENYFPLNISLLDCVFQRVKAVGCIHNMRFKCPWHLTSRPLLTLAAGILLGVAASCERAWKPIAEESVILTGAQRVGLELNVSTTVHGTYSCCVPLGGGKFAINGHSTKHLVS